MDRQSSATDAGRARKWYREPWPWILMGGPAIVVVASFTTLWLAIESSTGLVVDDYYEQGLAVNKVIDRDTRAHQLGLHGQLDLDEAATTLQLGAKAGVSLPGRIRLVVSNVARGGLDRSLTLSAAGGEWRGASLSKLPEGRWWVIAEDEAKTWRLIGSLSTPGEHRVTFGGSSQ